MFAEIRYRTGAGYANYTILRSTKDLSFDTKYLDVGAFGFAMRQEDADSLGIGDQSVVEIAPNGQSIYNGWYAIDGSSGTKTADDQLWRTFTGKSIINWLTDCIVYPSSWPMTITTNPDGTITPIINGHSFQNATPGNILATLIARGQQRGGLQWLDWSSFTGVTTSDGKPWAANLTVTYTTGQTLLQVLQDLASRRILQFRMNGMKLELFNYDAKITHWTPEQVSFQRGRNIQEHTDNTDSTQAGGTILIEGDTTAIQEYTDTNLTNAVGRRRERYVQQGGITDPATLTFLAQAELSVAGHVKSEETVGVKDDGITQPWFNYDVGDWVWIDADGTIDNVQIRQIAASGQDENNMKIGLTLGDLIDDQDIQLQKRIDNITGSGSSGYGALPNTSALPTFPATPGGPLGYTFTPYRDANGIDSVQVQLTWTPTTLNSDGTPCTDLDHYEIQYQLSGTPWSTSHNVLSSMSVGFFSPLPAGGVGFLARVRSVSHDGNASAWLTMASAQTLPKVTKVPTAPSTPGVSPFFQSIQIAWDGHDNTGAAYGAEFARIDVYVGTTANFTPTSPAASITANKASSVTINGLAYSTAYYVKLIAVDKSGNISAASVVSSAVTAAQLSDPDLPAKLVTGAKIADGAISVANLTVASFGSSTVPNGGFEDAATNTADGITGASRWTAVLAGTGTMTISRDTSTANINTGQSSLKSVGSGTESAWIVNTDDIATAPGDVWYIKVAVKASRSVLNGARVYLNFGQPGVSMPVQNNLNNPVVAAIDGVSLSTTWQTFEGQVVVPSGTSPAAVSKMRVVLSHETPDTTPLTIWWDAVEVRSVGGSASIRDASIVSAKINDLSVDKLTVGTLHQDILLSARIKTSDTGARVEINSSGLYAYDVNGNQTVAISSADGSAVFSGTVQVPSQQANAANDYPGQTTIDQNGFRQSLRTTVNTVPNPFPEFSSGFSNSFTVVMAGGTATGGTYTLRFRGQTTGAIAWNASAATVQTALSGLSTIGTGNVTVALVGATANVNGGYTVTFAGSLANISTPPVVVASTALTGTNPQNLTIQLKQAGTPAITLTSGITATRTSTPTYLNGALSMLYGKHGLQVSHASNTAATVGFPIGTHYEPNTFADFAAAGTAGGNIESGKTYVVSWYAMPNPVSSAFTPDTQPCYIDMSKVSIAYYDSTNTTLQGTLKSGIDGFISNVTPELAGLGNTYYPPTIYGNRISSGLFDLWKISNLPQANGGSSDLPPKAPLLSDYGWKRFYAVFTAPATIPDGAVFRLTLPATPQTSAGGNNSANMYVLYNALQCELAGSAGIPLPTRFCAAINTSAVGLVKTSDLTMPQCVALPWNYSGQRWAMPAGAIPTHSDSVFNGFVHLGSTTASDLTVGTPVNINTTPDRQTQVLTVQGQANISGYAQLTGGLSVAPGADPNYAGFSVGAGQSGLYYYEEFGCAPQTIGSSSAATALSGFSELMSLSDYGSAFNISNGVWTCPIDGPYMFHFVIGWAAYVTGTRFIMYMDTDGGASATAFARSDYNMGGNAGQPTSIFGMKFLMQGQTVRFRTAQVTGSSQTIDDSVSYVAAWRCL